MKRQPLILVILIIVVVAAGFGMYHLRATRAAAATKRPNPPVPVTVAIAATRDVPIQLTGIGNVRAFATVAVRSQQKGELMHVGFQEGDEVKQGDLIFTIDPRPFEAAVQQAQAILARDKALLAKAEADFRRAQELLATESISQAVFDQNQSAVDSLKATIAADEAALHNAQVQLEYCHIRSPITGRVGLLGVDRGNMVKAGDTVLAVINQLKPISVDFSVPEQSLAEVRAAAARGPVAVTAALPDQEDRRATGELTVINNEVDKTTGSVLLRATFPNTDELLWPGQFVNVALTLRVESNAVVVPFAALNYGQQGAYVFVVKSDATVDLRTVKSGARTGNEIVITEGVQAAEQVVTSGQLRLVPGARVELK